MRVCITGASSSVAEKIVERLRPAHALTLLDLRYRPNLPADIPRLNGSILDRSILARALSGQDAVIHTAIAPDETATDAERWRVNVEGTLAVVEEAVKAGVAKFVFASTLSVLDGYDWSGGPPGDESAVPRQRTFYGFTKYVGEQIVRFHAEKHGLKSVALRLVSVTPGENETGDERGWKFNPIFRTSGRDVAQAFQRALERDLESVFEIFHISGGHPKRFWAHDKATRLLGYRPVDTWEKKEKKN